RLPQRLELLTRDLVSEHFIPSLNHQSKRKRERKT
ncbi:hypothetical protein JMJ77_0010143, partial [Colletotrichum scovillei]